MGRKSKKSAKSHDHLEIIDTALEKTRSALEAAEAADLKGAKGGCRSRKLLKLVVVLGVLGVAVMVAKKLMSDDSDPNSGPDSKDRV